MSAAYFWPIGVPGCWNPIQTFFLSRESHFGPSTGCRNYGSSFAVKISGFRAWTPVSCWWSVGWSLRIWKLSLGSGRDSGFWRKIFSGGIAGWKFSSLEIGSCLVLECLTASLWSPRVHARSWALDLECSFFCDPQTQIKFKIQIFK